MEVVFMRALVVYESMYGVTHAVAIDVAAGLQATHEVTLVPVTRATPELIAAAGLIVAGGPTHQHGLSTVASRRGATETARQPGDRANTDPPWLPRARRTGELPGQQAAHAARRGVRARLLLGSTGRRGGARGRDQWQAVVSCGKDGNMFRKNPPNENSTEGAGIIS
jgi:hypothetical protein